MPSFFDSWSVDTGLISANNLEVYPYLDNKHQKLQLTLNALTAANVVFSVELLNGQYIKDFVDGFSNTGHLT